MAQEKFGEEKSKPEWKVSRPLHIKKSLIQHVVYQAFDILAVEAGFEPAVRLPVRQFSKLVVSATHPLHLSLEKGLFTDQLFNENSIKKVRIPTV